MSSSGISTADVTLLRSRPVNRVRWFFGYRGVYQFIWWKRGDASLSYCLRTASARWIGDLRPFVFAGTVLWFGWLWGVPVGFVLMIAIAAAHSAVEVRG